MRRFLYCSVMLASASLLPLVCQVVERPVPGDPVAIDSGAVSGKVLPSGVKAYFGIPFAAAPVGEFRWREPQPVKPWKGVYHADRKMQECIQVLRPHNINHYFGEEPTGEDCLYLNVWAPASAKAGANLPVLIYIYGGGSTIGSSGMALYGGDYVAARGAVFVNFNYRLGALGFMAHPDLTKASPHHQSGNYAYLDQVAALQWVQRNISKFGGDPRKVVISGQSAGAGSVSLLQASPLAKGLFRGVVAMSGGAWGNGGRGVSLADAEKVGLQVQEALKAKSIDDMRQVPADRILALQAEFQVGATGGAIRIGGANVDGYFLPKSPADLFAARSHSDVPAVIGFTHDESSNELRAAKDLEGYKAAARKLYGDAAEEFLKLYPASTDAEAREMGLTAARDGNMQRSQRNWAIAQTGNGSGAVFLFMYSRVHPYIPGVAIADIGATSGAYHTSDVPYWLGTLDALNMMHPTRNWTAYDRELSNHMMDALFALANTGNPGTSAVRWPQWKAGDERLVEFGNTINVQTINTARCAFMAIHGGGQNAPTGARD